MDSANGNFSGRASGAGVGAGGAIVSGGSGDVVLPAGGEKKSKWPLVAVVALVVLVVIVIVGVVMGRGGKGGDVAENWNESYALYANYLLDGKDSTEDAVGSYSSVKVYVVVTAAKNGDAEYFSKLQRLWKGFYGQVEIDDGEEENDELGDKVLLPETSQIAGDIEFQNELMDFLVKYAEVGEWGEEELMSAYAESGADGVNAMLDAQYDEVLSTIYEPGLEYAKAEVKALKAMVKVFSEYSARGCVSGSNIDDACVNANADILKDVTEQYISAENDVNDDVVNDALRYLVENCYAINENLGGINE